MGRSNMSSLKITFLPLAIRLLLSLNSQVSGKPSPKHFLIETKEKAKKNNDYTGNVKNVGGKIGGGGDGSWNSGDYTGNVKNVGGKIGGVGDGSWNSGDYTGNVKNVGGKMEELATAAGIMVTIWVLALRITLDQLPRTIIIGTAIGEKNKKKIQGDKQATVIFIVLF